MYVCTKWSREKIDAEERRRLDELDSIVSMRTQSSHSRSTGGRRGIMHQNAIVHARYDILRSNTHIPAPHLPWLGIRVAVTLYRQHSRGKAERVFYEDSRGVACTYTTAQLALCEGV